MALPAVRRPDRHHRSWQWSRLDFLTPIQIPYYSQQAQFVGSFSVVDGQCEGTRAGGDEGGGSILPNRERSSILSN